jgi:hypothetical protein
MSEEYNDFSRCDINPFGKEAIGRHYSSYFCRILMQIHPIIMTLQWVCNAVYRIIRKKITIMILYVLF